MKLSKFFVFAFLGLALAVTGCAKKSAEQASISGTGLDGFSSTEELAQLPQASTANQQGSVEVLPIETSPITQGVPPIAGPTSSQTQNAVNTVASVASDIASLTQDQKVQTALRNAGLYQGNIDGKIGPASKKAITEFQTAHNLKADGKVGPKTWAALEPYLSGAPETTSTVTTEQ